MMKRRSFLGRILAALCAAPAAVLCRPSPVAGKVSQLGKDLRLNRPKNRIISMAEDEYWTNMYFANGEIDSYPTPPGRRRELEKRR